MVVRVLVVLVCVVALAGCGSTGGGSVAETCTRSPELLLEALAKDPVVLPDGTTISQCARRALSDGDLQNVGVVFSRAAERLAVKGREGDTTAAEQLGYLIGATRLGAEKTTGVVSELQRRLEVVGGRLQADAPAPVGAAVDRGLERGRADG